MKYKQIFILGTTRSGTSIARNLLTDVFKYPSYGEGHILQLVSRHLTLITDYKNQMSHDPGLAISAIPLKSIVDLESSFLKGLYQAIFPNLFFLDKTPSSEAAYIWRIIAKAFDSCAFVFCIRNPVDVISSQILKFNAPDFTALCLEYVSCVNALFDIARSDCNNRMFIIDHRRTYADSNNLADELIAFVEDLNVTPSEVVNYWSNNWSDNLTHDPKSPKIKNLDETNWSDEQKKIFTAHCGKYMEMTTGNDFIDGNNILNFL